MKKKLYILTLIFTLLLTNCGLKHFYKKVSKKVKCLDKIYTKTKNTSDYNEVFKQFKDTLNAWTEKKLKLHQFSDPNHYFQDDIIYFNKKRNQCVLVKFHKVVV
jgi:hypothetical protein